MAGEQQFINHDTTKSQATAILVGKLKKKTKNKKAKQVQTQHTTTNSELFGKKTVPIHSAGHFIEYSVQLLFTQMAANPIDINFSNTCMYLLLVGMYMCCTRMAASGIDTN